MLWDQSTFFPLLYIPLVSNTKCTRLFTHSWMQACPAQPTAVHKSWRWSTTQTFRSPQTTNPTSYSDVFQRTKERGKKALSVGCHLTPLCFRISYCPLRWHVWTLWIRIFNDTQKSKEQGPQTDLTALRGTNDESRIWSRNMAACKKPFVTQTLKFCDLSHIIRTQTA